MLPTRQLQALSGKGAGGCFGFRLTEDREFVEKMRFGHPIARAASYCLVPDTF